MGNAGGNRMEPVAFMFFLVHIVLVKWLAFAIVNRQDKVEELPVVSALNREEDTSAFTDTVDVDGLVEEDTVFAPSLGNSARKPDSEELAPLFTFDPNQADSCSLVRLGIPLRVVRNILNYRRKGGVFRQADDLAKIYGMEPELFERLKPYVRMAKVEIELNSADSLQLTALRGIGAYTAHKILAYRQRLGGFYSLHQLDEVPDVRPDNLKELREVTRLDTSCLRKLQLATADVGLLRRHPYLDFYQAKAIVDFRSKHHRGPLLEDLEMLEEFSEDDLRRLRPYLP